MPRLPHAYRNSSNASRGSHGPVLIQATGFYYRRYGIHESTSVAHRPQLPLDDTRTLQYNTLISVHTAHLPQKYNTYTTYPRKSLMAARSLAEVRDAALLPNYFGQTCYKSPSCTRFHHCRCTSTTTATVRTERHNGTATTATAQRYVPYVRLETRLHVTYF